jgi:hypothetical protein
MDSPRFSKGDSSSRLESWKRGGCTALGIWEDVTAAAPRWWAAGGEGVMKELQYRTVSLLEMLAHLTLSSSSILYCNHRNPYPKSHPTPPCRHHPSQPEIIPAKHETTPPSHTIPPIPHQPTNNPSPNSPPPQPPMPISHSHIIPRISL